MGLIYGIGQDRQQRDDSKMWRETQNSGSQKKETSVLWIYEKPDRPIDWYPFRSYDFRARKDIELLSTDEDRSALLSSSNEKLRAPLVNRCEAGKLTRCVSKPLKLFIFNDLFHTVCLLEGWRKQNNGKSSIDIDREFIREWNFVQTTFWKKKRAVVKKTEVSASVHRSLRSRLLKFQNGPPAWINCPRRQWVHAGGTFWTVRRWIYLE